MAERKRKLAGLGQIPNVELRPDGWDRFKAAVIAAVKSGPKPRPAKKKKAAKPKK
jgi:hypothetical protein